MEQKYFKVKHVAEIFGLDPRQVRDFCNADRQDFAFKPVRGGNWRIDLKKFEKWITGRRTV